ncbi:MAG: DUF885 domain-containing protein [Woeseiaceae bacterium]|nr:DUF885 domain-containing protein [Woeseiaceae bacterium]
MLNSATGTPNFDRWLNKFFDFYYRHRPVNATFIGVHDYDGALPDFSASGIGDTLADMQSLLRQAASLSDESLNPAQRIDKRLCEGFLQIQCWEYEQEHCVRRNPGLYINEAIFGVLATFLTDYAPLRERVEVAAQRLHAIPDLLRQGQDNLRQAPAAWIRHAIVECRGAIAFLDYGAMLAPGQLISGSYSEGVARATRAFHKFGGYLDGLLEDPGPQCHGCGEEILSLHLGEAHCFEQDANDIVSYAEDQLAKASRHLDEHCFDFDAGSPADALAKLYEIHPTVDEYYGRYQEIWHDVQRIAEESDLLTWPEFPIRYVPIPTWARAGAPDLYFLNYRSPAAFGRPPTHDYLVTPIDTGMPAARQLELLRANNDSVIRLNHVVHHGGIGHHVQNWHAFRSSSRVGQIAAVDCASRIAMNCGGTMAEGWACYATDLIAEAGGLTPLEVYAEYRTRARMCARAIVDIRLHQGRLSFDQAVDFYVRNAGMSENAATYEATRNSMYPGSALMYLTGCDAIHELRAKLQALQQNRFDLRQFHDKFLSYGSLPVALIARAMLEEENQAGQ